VVNNLITANATALWKVSSASGAATTWTLSVSPQNLGDLMVFTTTYQTAGVMTALSGGGCNASGSGLDGAWQLLAGPYDGPAHNTVVMQMWMGKVVTTGASTITATISGMATGQNVRRNCKEFGTGGGLGTVWTQDGAGGTKANGTASTTVTYPTMTPSGLNRLYVGFGTNGTGSTTGATAGYTVELDPGTNPYLYNPSVANSAQTPTSVTSSSTSYTIAALIKADNPAGPGQFMPFFNHHDDELVKRASGLYVARKSFGYRAPARDRVMARVSR
jgi:hypothetical protein